MNATQRRALAAMFCLAALAACKREPAQAPSATPAPAATPTPAVSAPRESTAKFPALRLATVDGGTFDLAAHRGKWVVVNFWATWCAPCIKEMPELSMLDKTRDDIEVIGLAYEEIEPQAMRDFLRQRPVVYPVAILDVYSPPADFATPRGLPMTFLIAPDGKMAKQFMGPITAHEIDAAIAAAGGPKAKA